MLRRQRTTEKSLKFEELSKTKVETVVTAIRVKEILKEIFHYVTKNQDFTVAIHHTTQHFNNIDTTASEQFSLGESQSSQTMLLSIVTKLTERVEELEKRGSTHSTGNYNYINNIIINAS